MNFYSRYVWGAANVALKLRRFNDVFAMWIATFIVVGYEILLTKMGLEID